MLVLNADMRTNFFSLKIYWIDLKRQFRGKVLFYLIKQSIYFQVEYFLNKLSMINMYVFLGAVLFIRHQINQKVLMYLMVSLIGKTIANASIHSQM